jgi:hypothetical protein
MRVLFSVIAFRCVLLYDNAYGITLFARLQAGAAKSPQKLCRPPAAFAFSPLARCGPAIFSVSLFLLVLPAAITPNLQNLILKVQSSASAKFIGT